MTNLDIIKKSKGRNSNYIEQDFENAENSQRRNRSFQNNNNRSFPRNRHKSRNNYSNQQPQQNLDTNFLAENISITNANDAIVENNNNLQQEIAGNSNDNISKDDNNNNNSEEKIFNSLNELLTKLNESNEPINSNQLLDTLKIIENCTSCKKYVPRNKFDSFCKLLNKLKKISEELGKEENENRKAEIIYQLGDELNKLDVKINGILCDECQKENIFDPLCELLTKLNESNASINSNKLLVTLKIIEDCTGCKKCAQKNYFDLFYELLNKLKKNLEELDKEENEDREAEMVHKLSDELNELDVEINRIALCYGCQEKNIFNPLCKLLIKLNESNEPINSNKLLDTLKILENCTGCKNYVQKNNSDLFYKSLNKLKKISEELDKEESEDRKAEIIHKLGGFHELI
ncbi:2411_t:CDS:2 [Entrophospora sp. SA101]|nr:2411_t:CDS:2 [Entrophospora sp. SA101]